MRAKYIYFSFGNENIYPISEGESKKELTFRIDFFKKRHCCVTMQLIVYKHVGMLLTQGFYCYLSVPSEIICINTFPKEQIQLG